MKLITFAVPCYNSASYMEHCIESLLVGGDDIEIILIDDGSTDETPEIADKYASQYPNIVRVIHQPNGGHGEGVNQGLRNASGIYYKVVDSDDWVDADALQKILVKLHSFVENGTRIDLLICNYVYEHVADNTSRVIRYTSVFPTDNIFTWDEIGHFKPWQNILMHSVIYRTQILHDCHLQLPKHTFYVDNIFVYQPLPCVKNIYYMDENLYRYFIGRSDQSVNEQIMVKRVDQQLTVTKIMTDCINIQTVSKEHKMLGKYLYKYIAMMYTICSILLLIDGSPEAMEKRSSMWNYLQGKDKKLYLRLRFRSRALFTNFPGKLGRKFAIDVYHITQKIFKFN